MKLKKHFSLLLAMLLTLTLCAGLAGCGDKSVDPEAVKITVNGTDVSYGYKNTDGLAIFAEPETTPTDFTSTDKYMNELSIDLGENSVAKVEIDRAYLHGVDLPFIPLHETVSMRDGHVTLSRLFEITDDVIATDYIYVHVTVTWSEPMRVTQYAFSLHYIEEALKLNVAAAISRGDSF